MTKIKSYIIKDEDLKIHVRIFFGYKGQRHDVVTLTHIPSKLSAKIDSVDKGQIQAYNQAMILLEQLILLEEMRGTKMRLKKRIKKLKVRYEVWKSWQDCLYRENYMTVKEKIYLLITYVLIYSISIAFIVYNL